MDRAISIEGATIDVDDTETFNLRKGHILRHAEETIEMKQLPPVEIAPRDAVFVTASTEFRSILNFIKDLKIEVVFFLYMFSYIIRSVSSLTMIMEKVCNVHIQFPKDVCDNLDLEKFKSQKLQVEVMANNYHLFHTLVALTPSALMAPFIGPWSDKYSRKVPIIAALIGIIIDGTFAIFCAYRMDSRVEYYIACALFTGLSGGFITVFTVVYSFVSDNTSGDSRTLKYAVLEVFMGLGIPLGQLAGGWIYRYTGYVAVFSVSVSGHMLALLWIIFMIKETRGLDNRDCWEVKVRNFFSMERLKESYRAATKKRPHQFRMQLWLLIFSMSVAFLVMAGGSGISYLFTYHHYNWDNTKFSTVSSLFAIFSLFAMLISVPLCTKVFKLGDPTLGIIGTTSGMLKHFGISLSTKQGGYYLANLMGLVSSLATLAGRARISKIVSKDDLGKVFAFLSTVESLLPIAATAILSQVFNSTIGMNPDPSYLALSVCLLLSLAVYIWMAFLPKLDYEHLQDETPEPSENPEATEPSGSDAFEPSNTKITDL